MISIRLNLRLVDGDNGAIVPVAQTLALDEYEAMRDTLMIPGLFFALADALYGPLTPSGPDGGGFTRTEETVTFTGYARG